MIRTTDLKLTGKQFLQAIDVRVEPLSTVRLGVLLHDLRVSRKLNLRDVALLPELLAELKDIEAGRVRPDTAVISALLRCFDAELDELVPPRDTLVVAEGTDDEVLTRYLAAVRRWPGRTNLRQLRKSDFEVLARILRSNVEDVHRRLRHHAISEGIKTLSNARLGVLVHKLRHSGRVSQRKELLSPRMQSNLEDIQAGRLRPRPDLLEALLNYYDADIDKLVPPRETLVVTKGTDEEVLARYLSALGRWRGGVQHQKLREADLLVLAGILGTDPTDIQRRLRKLTGCGRRRACGLSAMLIAGIAVSPAVVTLLHDTSASATAGIDQVIPADEPRQAGDVAPAAPSVTATPTATVPAATAAVPAMAPMSRAIHHGIVAPPATVHTLAADCATALAYLALHAKPGFAHYCRPKPLVVGIPSAVAYTCVPGPTFSCPDGNAEIIIADPGCAIAYENEASNSYWDFSSGGIIEPGTTQNGRTWDPYGKCP